MLKITKNPHTLKYEKADWRKNENGQEIVQFPNGQIYYAQDWELPTRVVRYGKERDE